MPHNVRVYAPFKKINNNPKITTMKNYINEYQNYLKIKGLAERTIMIYSAIIEKFILEFPNPKTVTNPQIIAFMLKRGASRTIKQTHGALNHFYIGVLGSYQIKKIPQPKASDFVPNILTEIEIQQLLSGIKNLKHEAIIQLIYSCALRISEVINLKVEHISKTKNIIRIVSSKGGKTADIPIPEATKVLLRVYYKEYRPKEYLFQGQKTLKYSRSSIRKILKKALLKVNITRRIRVHDLRHSRATHWLENGMDIKFIQQILRHKKLETTERYLHLTTQSLEKAMQRADRAIQYKYQIELNNSQKLIKVA